MCLDISSWGSPSSSMKSSISESYSFFLIIFLLFTYSRLCKLLQGKGSLEDLRIKRPLFIRVVKFNSPNKKSHASWDTKNLLRWQPPKTRASRLAPSQRIHYSSPSVTIWYSPRNTISVCPARLPELLHFSACSFCLWIKRLEKFLKKKKVTNHWRNTNFNLAKKRHQR